MLRPPPLARAAAGGAGARDGIAEYLQDRDTLPAQDYAPGEAERLGRGLLAWSMDVLLVGVRPGRIEWRALRRRMGSRFG